MRILFLDYETTGLAPASHLPLEVAGICYDSDQGSLAYYSQLVQQDLAAAKQLCDYKVLEMHERSGLWEALATQPSLPQTTIDDQLCKFLDDHWGAGDTRIIIAGYSVKFDLEWSKYHLPKFGARLHYQVVDVSSLRKVWAMGGLPEFPTPPKKVHRALADCDEALGELKWYLEGLRSLAHLLSAAAGLHTTGILHP